MADGGLPPDNGTGTPYVWLKARPPAARLAMDDGEERIRRPGTSFGSRRPDPKAGKRISGFKPRGKSASRARKAAMRPLARGADDPLMEI